MEFIRLWVIFVLVMPSESVGIKRYALDLQENDYCGLDYEVYHGKCKKIKKCVNLLAEKKVIEVCSFSGGAADETLVCCSREDFYKSRSMIREGPLDYESCVEKYKHLRNVESDELSEFTVNGVDVRPGEFPHMAAIGWLKWIDFSVDWNCGGSLLTEKFVLTAAHCTSVDGRKPNVVRLGDIDLTSPQDDLHVQQFGISGIVRHPSYSASTNENDIALIEINGEVVPTRQVVPACVAAVNPTANFFEASGYGQEGSGLKTNNLSKVFLKSIPIEKCQESYESVALSSDSQMCAESYREDLGIQDTCYGESGSPLQYYAMSDYSDGGQIYITPTVVGMTSFGIGCAFGHPSVYVKVSHYIEWLESIIKP